MNVDGAVSKGSTQEDFATRLAKRKRFFVVFENKGSNHAIVDEEDNTRVATMKTYDHVPRLDISMSVTDFMKLKVRIYKETSKQLLTCLIANKA